jgi:hypothetical protein
MIIFYSLTMDPKNNVCVFFFRPLFFLSSLPLQITKRYKILSLSLSSDLSTRQRDKAIFWLKLCMRTAATNNVPLYLAYSCNGN